MANFKRVLRTWNSRPSACKADVITTIQPKHIATITLHINHSTQVSKGLLNWLLLKSLLFSRDFVSLYCLGLTITLWPTYYNYRYHIFKSAYIDNNYLDLVLDSQISKPRRNLWCCCWGVLIELYRDSASHACYSYSLLVKTKSSKWFVLKQLVIQIEFVVDVEHTMV